MQNNNYYSVIQFEASAESIQAAVQFNPLHAIFEGHFPQQPVVPGVCMIAIVKSLSEQALQQSLRLIQGHQIKFLQPIIPHQDDVIEVGVNLVCKDDVIEFTASFRKSAQAVFKMNGCFTKA
jgi:3-hydroxyacyl-[acyl-carrier-protein] dehydratase